MSTDILEVAEGTQYVSSDERKVYNITTTNVGTAPGTTVTVTAYDESVDASVGTTVFPTGTASVSGDVITLPVMRAFTKGHSYRTEVLFICGSSYHECWFRVKCVR